MFGGDENEKDSNNYGSFFSDLSVVALQCQQFVCKDQKEDSVHDRTDDYV